MEKEIRTVDSILSVLQTKIANKEVVDAITFIEAAEMLNVLLSNETDKLFELQQKVAAEKVARISETKCSVAQAKLEVESLDIFVEMKRQEAKIARVIEMGRLAKIHARLKDSELKGY